ncbi:MAG: alpha/beta hydrolase [Confluentimicrobium sp.]|nr:alpha/beta hydrolase [Actibacterium sp.]MBF52221.1 alpha/beta hydrolase [Actibacterium sp.]
MAQIRGCLMTTFTQSRGELTRRGVLLGATALGLAGCGTAPDGLATKSLRAGPSPVTRYRLPVTADLAAWDRHIPARTRAGRPQILALSGGGEDGAFGAGALTGWSATGKRPEFDIVTGISTGALIAPFAFLGADHDPVLRDIFLTHDADDLMQARTLSVIYSNALYDTAPLAALIESYTPPALLRDIAARHDTGARLFVVTTVLESGQGVVWDMGEIARDGQIALFRAVLRASAAIPGLFPPVGIAAERGGVSYGETHVDGGITMPFLALPPAAQSSARAYAPGGHLHVIVNNTLEPEPQTARRSALGVSQQALTAMVRSGSAAALRTARIVARQNGLAVSTASVGTEVGSTWDASDRFAPDYMRRLFDHGYDRARSDRLWR